MRKLLTLTFLSLVLVAAALPTRKATAESPGADCTAATVAAVAADVAYIATCQDAPHSQACDDALDKYLDAQTMMQIVCAPR